jgi:hypothetical protein
MTKTERDTITVFYGQLCSWLSLTEVCVIWGSDSCDYAGSMTKAQTTKVHRPIPHRQNRTVINSHATKARTDNSAHAQIRTRTIARTDKYAHVQTHIFTILSSNTLNKALCACYEEKFKHAVFDTALYLTRWYRLPVFAELISSTLKMEAICSSETSVETKLATRRYKSISQDDTACRFSLNLLIPPWRWRRYVSPKRILIFMPRVSMWFFPMRYSEK